MAVLNCYFEHHGFSELRNHMDLIAATLPPETWVKVRPLLESGDRSFASPQVLMTLLKLVLQNAADSPRQVDPQTVGLLALFTADHVGGVVGAGDPDWTLELARYGLFYDYDSHLHHWGRAQRIWLDLLPSLTEDPDFVNLEEVVEEATGVPLRTYLALGLGYTAYFDAAVAKMESPFWVKLDSDVGIVDPEHVRRTLVYLSGTRDWYQARFAGEALYGTSPHSV